MATSRVWSPRQFVGRGTLMAIFLISSLTFSAVIDRILTIASTTTPGLSSTTGKQGNEDPLDEDCVDIAVVGAGIGGSYTSWKLRGRGLAISVFEYSDRVGGRLFSPTLPVAPGTYLEFGAMRFDQDMHPLLTKTVREIGLHIIPFPLNFGNSNETVWYMRNTHMRHTDLGTSKMPYKLSPWEQTDPDTLLWNIFNDNVNITGNTFPSNEELYSLVTRDGRPLYKMSYDSFLKTFASQEASRYLLATNTWADGVGRQMALHGPKVFLSYPGHTFNGLSTIEGGMDKIALTLMQKFLEETSKHKLHLNHQVMGIDRRNSGGYNLRLRKTQTKDGVTTPLQGPEKEIKLCTKKVILAAQRNCIEDIDFPSFRNNPDILRNINSVVGYKAGKIFLAYNSKWWKINNTDITHTRSDLPNRQTYDWQTGTNNVSILMTYHDGDSVEYWRELSKFGTPIPGSLPGANAVTDVVKNRLEKYLSLIYDVKQEDIPPAVGGGMISWDSYPYSNAWEFFKPGFDEREVGDFIQKPSPDDEVYIVSGSWSPGELAVWAVGPLQAADNVLQKYFEY